MDNIDKIENSSTDQPDLNELKQDCASLRQLVLSLMVLMVVVSGTLNLFLMRLYKDTKNEVRAKQPQIAQMMTEYNRMNGPAFEDFIKKLQDFSKTHPDFTPILQKYIGKPAAAPALPAAAPTGAPAPAKK